jgi:hypothetical protein
MHRDWSLDYHDSGVLGPLLLSQDFIVFFDPGLDFLADIVLVLLRGQRDIEQSREWLVIVFPLFLNNFVV